MTLWVLAWALWSLTVWYQVHFWLPARREIQSCGHTRGRLTRGVPDPRRGGRYTALIWRCRDCPLQVPLALNRATGQVSGQAQEHSVWIHVHDRKDGR